MTGMSSAVESAIQPILHSPLLCEIAETLQSRVRDEAARRRRFYEELRDDQKAEFIDGQVILHSRARDKQQSCRRLSLEWIRSSKARNGGIFTRPCCT
jgi:hypothetical protein